MAYTPDKPKLAESSDELRARIPGWGADLGASRVSPGVSTDIGISTAGERLPQNHSNQ